MYTALYRAQRPEVFSEIIGQDHIVRILRNQIRTGTVSHAYLFCGTRGTGKTTTARILAKAVNCLADPAEGELPCGLCASCRAIKEGTFMDVIEIDAASNNGVDNIRELRESVKYPPAAGRKKVYIIDEVHMLSTGAFNALLKTLEEPPENVMFILATTDPQKLPQTILSRCMRLDFRRVPERELIEHLSRICRGKGVSITDSALRLLAANADGSVRDGLSILDQCLSAGDKEIDRDLVLDFLGTVSEEFFIDLTERTALHDVAGALVLLDGALQEGKDVKQLMKDWLSHFRGLLITKYIRNAEDMLNMSSENIEKLRDQSNRISLDEINSGIITLSRTINDSRYSTQPRVLLELAIVTIAAGLSDAPISGSSGAGQMRTGQGAKPVQQASVPVRDGARRPQNQMSKPPVEAMRAQAVQAEHPQSVPQTESPAQQGLPVSRKDPPEPRYEQYDLDEIWMRVFEEGEKQMASFNLLRTGSTLAAMNEKEFKVITHGPGAQSFVERNQALICDIMESITGKQMRLVCRSDSREEDDSAGQEMEELAKEISRELHIPVKVQ